MCLCVQNKKKSESFVALFFCQSDTEKRRSHRCDYCFETCWHSFCGGKEIFDRVYLEGLPCRGDRYMTTLWSSAVSVVPSVSSASNYIYDDDEELRTILLSCKKYRDTMDMIVRAAKAYRRSLGELAVAGKAAGEVYTCVAEFSKSTVSTRKEERCETVVDFLC